MVHFNDLNPDMVLATTLSAKNERLILSVDTVIKDTLLSGIKKPFKVKATEEQIHVQDSSLEVQNK